MSVSSSRYRKDRHMYTVAGIICIVLGIVGAKEGSSIFISIFGVLILCIAGPLQGVF